MKTLSAYLPRLAVGVLVASTLTLSAGATEARSAHRAAHHVVHHTTHSHAAALRAHKTSARRHTTARNLHADLAEEKYAQAAVEHLGSDETAVLGSAPYKGWAAEYDYAAKDRVCSGKAAVDANAHLLRGCLHRFKEQQILDVYYSS